MPLSEGLFGTNADGSKNEDYCIYCYKEGKFLQDCTMDEMIEHCTNEEYIARMKMYFPQLKRWQNAGKGGSQSI